MIVINDAVYVRSASGYTKCEIHKKKLKGRDVFSLKETSSTVKTLPANYENLTLPEIWARYGQDAIDDDAKTAGGK